MAHFSCCTFSIAVLANSRRSLAFLIFIYLFIYLVFFGASESPNPHVTSASVGSQTACMRQVHHVAPAFCCGPPSFHFLVLVTPTTLFWLICFPDSHFELPPGPLSQPAACQDTLRSHVVTANVTKPAAHHCPASLSTAGIGCKGHSPGLA